MSDKPSSTNSHAEHTSLLDTQGYKVEGEKSFIPMRDAESLGVESIGDSHRVTVYDRTTDTHHRVAEYGSFTSKADAQMLVDRSNEQVRGKIVIDESASVVPSIDELRRTEASAKRRAKEREEGHFGNKHSGVYLDY